MSYEPVPDGELAAVVTYLEMREPPTLAASAFHALAPHDRRDPEPDDYRRLFRRSDRTGCGSRALSWTTPSSPPSSTIRRSSCSLSSTKTKRKSACSSSTSARPASASSPSSAWSRNSAGQGHGRWLLAEAAPSARGATACAGSTSTPARSIIRRRSPPTARRVHAVQARGRAFPRPAPARHVAERLRASGPAARNARSGPRLQAERKSAPA